MARGATLCEITPEAVTARTPPPDARRNPTLANSASFLALPASEADRLVQCADFAPARLQGRVFEAGRFGGELRSVWIARSAPMMG